MLKYEIECQNNGFKLIGGMDEVGRGCLAGEVCSALVIMPLDDIIEGVRDSKKLSEKKREFLYDKIVEKAIAIQLTFGSEELIDEVNILNATKYTMLENIKNIKIKPEIILVDAVKLDTEIPTISIIKGDDLSYSIACASIVAKVTRDRKMIELDASYPQYAFAKNKGYGTKVHIEALKKYGATKIHRRSFIKNFICQ